MHTVYKSCLIYSLYLLSSFWCDAAKGEGSNLAVSPDGLWLAATGNVPDAGYIWDRKKDHCCLVVWPFENGATFDKSFLRWDSIAAVRITNILWSPDSQYLLVATSSSGGHSPWHFPSYVFCWKDKTIRYMDSVVEPILSPKFVFKGPSSVVILSGDPAKPSAKMIDLKKTFSKMPIVEKLQYIDDKDN